MEMNKFKYGEEVLIRLHLPMEKQTNHPYKNKINSNISAEKSLKDTFERVIPILKKN